jgi:hypothetical protein
MLMVLKKHYKKWVSNFKIVLLSRIAYYLDGSLS